MGKDKISTEQNNQNETDAPQEEQKVLKVNQEIIDLLKGYEYITDEMIEECTPIALEENISLEAALIKKQYIGHEHIAAALAYNAGMPFVQLTDYDLDEEIISKIPEKMAKKNNIIPIQHESDKLVVAISDPHNIAALDDISLMLGYYVEAVIAPKNQITEAINNFYASADNFSMADYIDELDEDAVGVVTDGGANSGQLESVRESDTPVIKFVNMIIMQALRDRASDIHFEPFEKMFRIRERIDGVLIPMQNPPKNLQSGIISRIKIMADLNIADTRMPQDGSIRLKMGGKSIDLRVACIPTMFGEAVVLRILDRSSVLLTMSDLGLSEHIEKSYRNALKQPNGIIMITGPTGCGKTTTLYAGMMEINKPEDKVITVEDPVEYEMYGMMQNQVNEKIGMTFGSALRAILRQDPDTILIGEMRDPETAAIAIESALTGHLVLSTTHTNEAAGTITRLIDMGAEPFLITSTLQTIIGQRLVRTICPNCQEEYTPPRDILLKLGKHPEDFKDTTFVHGKGCEHCAKTGYYGRIGLFECLDLSESLIDLIVKKSPANIIHARALEEGMIPMREDGWHKVLEGKTTVEEVIRVAPVEAGISIEE